MTLKIKGELEIDRERGVIYFHSAQGYTALRICNLPTPIPTTNYENGLDITFGVGCSWKGKAGKLQLGYHDVAKFYADPPIETEEMTNERLPNQ
jgi:hypothetical protein